MKTYKLIIGFEGTRFSGWQIQPNSESIQQHLEEALTILLREKTAITGSGRTDAGVHAEGLVAHFKTEQTFDLTKTLRSLNGILPEDIRVFSLEPAPDSFHARYSAKGKIYTYSFYHSHCHDPLIRRTTLFVGCPLDYSLLEQGCRRLEGEHDFAGFQNAGTPVKDTVRTIFHIKFSQNGPLKTLEFCGNGFLYKMVRNMVGMLLDVAKGKRPLEDIEKVLASKDRRLCSAAAPPQGLCLKQVMY